jgi:hypothetical protein
VRLSQAELLALVATGQDPERLLAQLAGEDDARVAKLAAVPRWFDEAVMSALLEPDADAAAAVERLAALRLTERAPGSAGAVRLRSSARQEYLQRWWRDGMAKNAVPLKLKKVSECLADHFQSRGEEIEALFHRLAVKPEEAAK